MFRKSPKVSSCSFLLISFFCIFFQTKLQGFSEQNKIIWELRNEVEKGPTFYGCVFALFDPGLPEHKKYYENIEARDKIREVLSERLRNELVPGRLNYFFQFKEKIHITRQHGFLTKDQADYCILYDKQFNDKTKPWEEKRTQRWYDKSVSECNEKFEKFCIKLNRLESFINDKFLRYYALGYPSYDKCNAIYDHGLVQLAIGDIEKAVSLADDFLQQANKENKDLKSFSSEQLLNLGVTYNEAMEYSKAVDFLNESIGNDPSNKEAYFQRAISYLELGLFENAVSDFLVSAKEKNLMPILSEAPDDFRDAFLHGLVNGSQEAAINFIPSLFSFAYTTMVHPIDSLTNFIDACHELMHVTKDYLKEVNLSQVENTSGLAHALVEPGLKRLFENMDHLSPGEQGHLLGHSIGSFGIDFVAGTAVIKGINNAAKLANACKSVRETGRIYELEALASSEASTEELLSSALERAAIKESIINSAKNNRIVIKNPNTQFHIMQEKHAWDKVITLTGNVQEDFKKVALLLEENSIMSKGIIDATNKFGNTVRTDYKIRIKECEIQAVFETDTVTNETFLKNAWVVMR